MVRGESPANACTLSLREESAKLFLANWTSIPPMPFAVTEILRPKVRKLTQSCEPKNDVRDG